MTLNCHDCKLPIEGEVFRTLEGLAGCDECSQECVRCPECGHGYALPVQSWCGMVVDDDLYRCVRCGAEFNLEEAQ